MFQANWSTRRWAGDCEDEDKTRLEHEPLELMSRILDKLSGESTSDKRRRDASYVRICSGVRACERDWGLRSPNLPTVVQQKDILFLKYTLHWQWLTLVSSLTSSDFYSTNFKRGASATTIGVTKPHMDEYTFKNNGLNNQIFHFLVESHNKWNLASSITIKLLIRRRKGREREWWP